VCQPPRKNDYRRLAVLRKHAGCSIIVPSESGGSDDTAHARTNPSISTTASAAGVSRTRAVPPARTDTAQGCAGLPGEEMTRREQPKGHWMILGAAMIVGSAAVIVGLTLEAPPSADDKRIFFVIAAGLLAVVLFLIAEVWRFVAIERSRGR